MTSTETTTSYGTARDYPRIGFYLSLFGAFMILAEAVWAIFFGSVFYAIILTLGVGLAVLFLGILLLINAIIIGSAATSLRAYTDQRVLAGATIVIFSLLALLLGGGFIIGSLAGIAGGILAIINI